VKKSKPAPALVPRPGSSLDRMVQRLKVRSPLRKRSGCFAWLEDPKNSEARELVRLWVEMLAEGTCDWSEDAMIAELKREHGFPYNDPGRFRARARAYFADKARASA